MRPQPQNASCARRKKPWGVAASARERIWDRLSTRWRSRSRGYKAGTVSLANIYALNLVLARRQERRQVIGGGACSYNLPRYVLVHHEHAFHPGDEMSGKSAEKWVFPGLGRRLEFDGIALFGSEQLDPGNHFAG